MDAAGAKHCTAAISAGDWRNDRPTSFGLTRIFLPEGVWTRRLLQVSGKYCL